MFKLTLAEDHVSYDVIVAEFNVTPDEAYSIIDRYVYEPERKNRFLDRILSVDSRLDTRQKHVKELEELDELVASLVHGDEIK